MKLDLTATSKYFKVGLKIFLAIFFLYYLTLFWLGPQTRALFKKMFPVKDTSTPVFGLLDQMEFIEKPINGQKPKVILNTKNGQLPTNLPVKLRVYKFKTPKYSYLAGKDAQEDAAILGFSNQDLTTDLKQDIYKWRNSLTGSNLQIRILTREVELDTPFTGKAKYYAEGTIDEQTAKTKATNLLLSLDRYNDEFYPKGFQVVNLGEVNGNQVIKSYDQRSAQLALVDFYRKMSDKYTVLGPDPKKGLLRVMIKGAGSNQKSPLDNPMVELYYKEINPDTPATYPLIDIEDAWKAVEAGKGVISNVTRKDANPFASYEPERVEEILVDNISVAYYENTKAQKYLQPIYVFSGKYRTRGTIGGDIIMYFPAIKGQHIKPNVPTPTPTPTPMPSMTPVPSPVTSPTEAPVPSPTPSN